MPTKLQISLDAEKYQQNLNKVVANTRSAATKMTGNLNATGKDLGKTITIPSESTWKKASNGIRECWKEMTNLNLGAKKFVSTMFAGGGVIGITMAACQFFINGVVTLYDKLSQRGKEAADTHRQFADSIAEAAANNDRLKQSSNEAITQLSAMANAAKLSNTEQEKAVSLIAALTRQYGDLGLSVDKATGKIKGLGAAIVEKETRDTQRQIRSIEAQLKERRNARNQEDQNIGNAGYNVGKTVKNLNRFSMVGRVYNALGITDKINSLLGLDKKQVGGEQDAKEAAERRAKDDKEIQELEMKRQEAKKKLAELAKKQLEQTRIQNAALEEEKKERDKQAKYRSADNELGRMRYAEDKIANRQALIDSEKKDNDALRARTAAAKVDMDRYAPSAKEADAQKYADAQRVYLQNAAEQAKSDEKIAGWQNQIKQLEYERAEAKKRMVEQAQFELDYSRLIAAGEYDKAAALKQEYDLKQRNLKLTEKEKQTLLDSQKAQKALNLQISNRDQALDLKWRAMEAAGKGKEASEQRALWDAEQRKGGKLTDSEIEAIRKLHELTCQFNNRGSSDFGGMAFRTDSLIARGGFQTGVTAPDTDKYNRIIADNGKTMLSVVQRIETICRKFGNF